jgi:hypothetical protein
MKSPITTSQVQAATAEDKSVCLEWQGFQHQSYDSVDSLLHEFTHATPVHSADQAGAVAVTVMGQYDGLLPLSHYLL